ncbi:MAG: hypothetical protein A2W29_06025 [Gemmatimonadetes bacterium RBG_16_66_8]|nr:MAG: hypothetical protein A2W29_06025 [Gemmatimonadetes bacterium RBG_16_66_8]
MKNPPNSQKGVSTMKRASLIGLVLLPLFFAASSDAVAQDRGLILIDRTGSMGATRANGHTRCADAVTQAGLDVLAFFNQYPGGLMAIWTFTGNAPTAVTGYVGQAAALAAVNGLPPEGCGGVTPLAEAICDASTSLAGTGAATKILYVSSDGGENNSDGPCSGPYDADQVAPWDAGSWQANVIASLTGNAVTNVRFWGAGAAPQGGVANLESKAVPAAPLGDIDFFQDLATQTGGTYTFMDDQEQAVPALGQWGLAAIAATLLIAGTWFIIVRRRSGYAVV